MSQFSTRLRSFQIHRTRSRAKKLVANKQSREAIDFLQRKNRNLQSPKIENQLAQLRHDAFSSVL